MGEKLCTLIQEFKDGDKTKFLLIVEKMNPLINKYVRLLYKDEKEDMYSEFVLCLLESITIMEYYNDEGQCVFFLSRAIKNKFYELYKKSRKQFDNSVEINDDYFESLQRFKESEYEDFIFTEDLHKFLLKSKGKQYHILYAMVFNDETDTEISEKFGVSRQYVNRIRRKFYRLLKEEYFSSN